MANAGTDMILESGGAGILQDGGGNLTADHRNRFVADVISLIKSGNANGLGLARSSSPKLSIPIMPSSGPRISAPKISDSKDMDALFHFSPDATADLSIKYIRQEDGPYHKLIIDQVYLPLIKMFNQAGTPSFPIFDPTIFMNLDDPRTKRLGLLDMPVVHKELTILGNLSPLKIMPGVAADSILLAQYGITGGDKNDLIAHLLAMKPPMMPSVSTPSSPSVESPNSATPDLFLPDFAAKLFKIAQNSIPTAFSMFLVHPTSETANFSTILNSVYGSILSVLDPILEFAVPKVLMATLIVIIRNTIMALICFMIGKILGTGRLVKIFADIGGLSSLD